MSLKKDFKYLAVAKRNFKREFLKSKFSLFLIYLVEKLDKNLK